MKLRLMTPERTLFEGEVASVAGRTPGGDFEVLPGHGHWVSSVDPCSLRLRQAGDAAGEVEAFAVHGGLIEVHPDSVLVLADTAEVGGEVDEERARQARARAEDRLKRRTGEGREVDVDRARRSLARALARIEAYAARS